MRLYKAKETSRLKRLRDATINVQLVSNPNARFAMLITVRWKKPYYGMHREIHWYWMDKRYYSNSSSINYGMRRGMIILKRIRGIRDDKTYKSL
jgi:hypothetical protein